VLPFVPPARDTKRSLPGDKILRRLRTLCTRHLRDAPGDEPTTELFEKLLRDVEALRVLHRDWTIPGAAAAGPAGGEGLAPQLYALCCLVDTATARGWCEIYTRRAPQDLRGHRERLFEQQALSNERVRDLEKLVHGQSAPEVCLAATLVSKALVETAIRDGGDVATFQRAMSAVTLGASTAAVRGLPHEYAEALLQAAFAVRRAFESKDPARVTPADVRRRLVEALVGPFVSSGDRAR
jgi:hypothetical protein